MFQSNLRETPGGTQATLRGIQSCSAVRNGGDFFLPSEPAIPFLANLEIAPA